MKEKDMIPWIGLCAGEIWKYIEEKGGDVRMKSILSSIKAPKETILMALGWLARENQIIIGNESPNPCVRLSAMPEKK